MKKQKEIVNPFLDSLEKILKEHGSDVKAVDLFKYMPSLTERVTTREYLTEVDPFPVNAYVNVLVQNGISPTVAFEELEPGIDLAVISTYAKIVSYLNLTEEQIVYELLPLVREIVKERIEAITRISNILKAKEEREKEPKALLN